MGAKGTPENVQGVLTPPGPGIKAPLRTFSKSRTPLPAECHSLFQPHPAAQLLQLTPSCFSRKGASEWVRQSGSGRVQRDRERWRDRDIERDRDRNTERDRDREGDTETQTGGGRARIRAPMATWGSSPLHGAVLFPAQAQGMVWGPGLQHPAERAVTCCPGCPGWRLSHLKSTVDCTFPENVSSLFSFPNHFNSREEMGARALPWGACQNPRPQPRGACRSHTHLWSLRNGGGVTWEQGQQTLCTVYPLTVGFE